MGQVRAQHPREAESLVGEGGEQPAWAGKQNRIQRLSLLRWLHPPLSSTGLTGPCRASAPRVRLRVRVKAQMISNVLRSSLNTGFRLRRKKKQGH